MTIPNESLPNFPGAAHQNPNFIPANHTYWSGPWYGWITYQYDANNVAWTLINDQWAWYDGNTGQWVYAQVATQAKIGHFVWAMIGFVLAVGFAGAAGQPLVGVVFGLVIAVPSILLGTLQNKAPKAYEVASVVSAAYVATTAAWAVERHHHHGHNGATRTADSVRGFSDQFVNRQF